MALRGSISKRRRSGQKSGGRSYEAMMKTLLLQNQQIIIQQQNMMFMVMKQFHPDAQLAAATTTTTIQSPHDPTSNQMQQALHLNQMQQPLQHNHLQQQQQQHRQQHQPQHHLHHLHLNSQQEQEHHHHHQQQQQHSLQEQQQGDTTISTNGGNAGAGHLDQQEQQRIANLQDSLGSFMTPAQSEQDPISENGKPDQGASESDALSALLEGDSLLTNNLLYNPCTDVGSITPYKNHHGQGQHQSGSQQQSHHHHQLEHQTPSYYSSGCDSLSTPRVEQQCQPVNISQNVVKNLNNSFKSPSKPQINVQILSGSATREMRKAKIIQSMNISEFLRQVHHDDAPKSATQ